MYTEHPKIIKAYNEKFAVLNQGGTFFVHFHDDGTYDQLRESDFRIRLANRESFKVAGQDKPVPAWKFWSEHKDRRELRGIVFSPKKIDDPSIHNTWRGFQYEQSNLTIEQAKKVLELYLWHVLYIICSGDKVLFDYLIKWMAHLVQVPWEKPTRAIVLRGGQGVGKGSFVQPIMAMVGQHSLHVHDREEFFDNFTGSLEAKLVVFLDEAFWAGHHREIAVLNARISEKNISIHRKYHERKQKPCFMRIIMASNDDWIVPAGEDARRYFCLDVSNQKQQNSAYFAPLIRDNVPKIAEALYVYLKTIDLKGFDVTKPSKTKALTDQQKLSLGNIKDFWEEKLEDESLPSSYIHDYSGDDETWPAYMDTRILYKSYIEGCNEKRIPEHKRETRKKFTKLIKSFLGIPKAQPTTQGISKTKVYKIPSHAEAVRAWEMWPDNTKTEWDV